MKTMLQIEQTFFDLAENCTRDCLVICDRGIMDASACKLWGFCGRFVGVLWGVLRVLAGGWGVGFV